jgi:S-adenosylmethionine:tRNA ribosyltransferase-isomerase
VRSRPSAATRALEGAASKAGGELEAGEGWTDLRLGPGSRLRVVDGIVTGLHETGTSHFELLEAFAPRLLLERAGVLAEERGYADHEFGDSLLILPGCPGADSGAEST